MTTEKRARAVGIPRQGAGIRQVSHFSDNVYKSRSPADKCRVYDKPNELILLRSPAIIGCRHSMIGGCRPPT